ncbi:MAG: glycosyltransferase [Chloroflexota bacterium]|nr:glycosyltransferase [Chloroflexota bacterium]
MISVICTVLNEGESIRALLESLAAQTQSPDEIVVVDGGSRDNTVAILHEYAARLPLRVISQPGANISAGRNRALTDARGDIIAITDAGVVLDADWLRQITLPFSDAAVNVVCGWFEADVRTVFEAALGATTLPHLRDIDPHTFLPSSRSVAVRKAACKQVGGYPEWLDYCEDLIFDMRLKQVAGAFAFAPQAVAHFRPRPSLGAFYRQYYRYARGDGKADLWRKRHAVRYVTYLVAAPAIIVLALLVHPAFWLLALAGAAVYLRTPYRRLPEMMRRLALSNLSRHGRPIGNGRPVGRPYAWGMAMVWVPVIRVVGDIAKMLGYPVGLAWRRRTQPPEWRVVSSA